MRKIIFNTLFILIAFVFASFIDKQTSDLILIDKLHQSNVNIEDTIKFESKEDSIQYMKNKKLEEKLDEIKQQQNLLDSLINSKQ